MDYRRRQDKEPRTARLQKTQQRALGSLLELEEKGMLEGGGTILSVGSVDLNKKDRRPLEMQKRSSRIQAREVTDSTTSSLDHIFHMIRTICTRGFNLEEYYVTYGDTALQGKMPRKMFCAMIQNLVPINEKELRIIIEAYGNKIGQINSQLFFHNVGVNIFRDESKSLTGAEPYSAEEDGSQTGDSRATAVTPSVLHQLQHLITHSLNSLNKSPNDLLKLFASYDRVGKREVTAVQFIRVLQRIHVRLLESEEDSIIDVLDTNRTGKIDYLSVLRFCFSNNSADKSFQKEVSVPFEGAVGKRQTGRPQSAINITPSKGAMLQPRNQQRPLTATARLNSSATKLLPAKISSSEDYGDDSDFVQEVEESDIDDEPDNEPDNEEDVARQKIPFASPAAGRHSTHTGASAPLDDFDISEDGGSVASNISFVVESPHYKGGDAGGVGRRGGGEALDHYTGSYSSSSLQWYNPSEAAASVNVSEENTVVRNVLQRLRELILKRHRQGHTLKAIFAHFDRDHEGYFDAQDFTKGLMDLKLDIPVDAVSIALASIAVDGRDKVALSEFLVFVTDDFRETKLLENKIISMFVEQLMKYGVDFLKSMERSFRISGMQSGNIYPKSYNDSSCLEKQKFLDAFTAIGVYLSRDELSRIATRFDIFDAGTCSVPRLLSLLRRSADWQREERASIDAEDAYQEAAQAKRLLATHSRAKFASSSSLGIDLINMAEYLGIKCISEPNLLWIARQALQAPLPPQWVAKKDVSGNIVFYNTHTKALQSEHPLDPHFRVLRDTYRNSSNNSDTGTKLATAPAPKFTLDTFGISQAKWRSSPSESPLLPSSFSPYDLGFVDSKNRSSKQQSEFSFDRHFESTSNIYRPADPALAKIGRPSSAIPNAMTSLSSRTTRAVSAGRIRVNSSIRSARDNNALVSIDHIPAINQRMSGQAMAGGGIIVLP